MRWMVRLLISLQALLASGCFALGGIGSMYAEWRNYTVLGQAPVLQASSQAGNAELAALTAELLDQRRFNWWLNYSFTGGHRKLELENGQSGSSLVEGQPVLTQDSVLIETGRISIKDDIVTYTETILSPSARLTGLALQGTFSNVDFDNAMETLQRNPFHPGEGKLANAFAVQWVLTGNFDGAAFDMSYAQPCDLVYTDSVAY
jgi:hypothetical protein